ncbi:MAG: HEAT repeat domain-containing protein [Verrucomicrobia bacterium]|nr:HEAT repeat domain-containing protein [Verrucomicrobiota bacterium]
MQSDKSTKAKVSPSSDVADIYATLAEALTHDDASVRESAAREFGERKEKRGINLLVELLTDDSSKVRFEAATALNELGWRPANDLLQARHAVALHQFQAAAKLGEVAVEPLLLIMAEGDIGLRMAALETLAYIGGTKVLQPLCEVISDSNPHMRAVAVQALCTLAAPQAIEPLAKLSRDPSWEVRSVALDALEAINLPACVAPVSRFLKDETADLRMRAAELLGRLGERTAITPLIAAALDVNSAVRDTALVSLNKLDSAWEKSDYAKQATRDLLDALKHEESDVQKAAADLLRTIGQTPAMNSFLTAEVGAIPQGPMAVLAHGLKSTNRDLRQASAEALGQLGDQAAIPMMVKMLRDEDQFVREAAMYALNLLNWKPANDTDLVLRAVVLQQWETAVLFDALAVEPLVMVLESENVDVCRAAVESLGKIGHKRAEEPLSVMLGHYHKSVRTAAAHALRLMGWQPNDARDFALLAIELGDWETVKMQGEIAVAPLITQIKEHYHTPEFANDAMAALAEISDPRAVSTLLSYTRDGQIAETVMQALENIMDQAAGGIEVADLKTLAALNNLVQFRYAFDPKYGAYVRSGLQEVDSSKLKKLAGQELARRS